MGSKDELIHSIKILNKVRPLSCANAAAFDTGFTTTNVDMLGYEACTFLLQFADDNATPNHVFRLMETDVSATDAGTNVADGDMIVHGHTAAGAAADTKIASGVLTMTANADEDNIYSFTYIGDKRWVRLDDATGNTTNVVACMVIMSSGRHMPKIA